MYRGPWVRGPRTVYKQLRNLDLSKGGLILRPQPGPQEVFLSTEADVAVYGGAAGGG